jgi:hypothetical protein
MWTCDYSIYLIEENRSNPDQWTLRDCSSPGRPLGANGNPDYSHLLERSPNLYVQRARNSRKLRIIGAWRMTCEVDEQTIGWWNERGAEYQPNVTESIPHEEIDVPPDALALPRDDLLPAPAEAPPGPAPGPLNELPGATPSKAAAAHSKSSSMRSRPGGYPSRCTPWKWLTYPNGVYAVYACFWDPERLPDILTGGAGLGIFNTATFYEMYYWTGNYYGWRLFQAGTTGPVAGSASP